MPLHDWQAIKLNGRTLKEIQKINILRWKYISMNFKSGVKRLWKQKVLARYIKIIFYSVCLVFSDLLELNKGIHFNKTGSDSYYLFYAFAPKVAGGIKFSVCPSFFFFFLLFVLFVCMYVWLFVCYCHTFGMPWWVSMKAGTDIFYDMSMSRLDFGPDLSKVIDQRSMNRVWKKVFYLYV